MFGDLRQAADHYGFQALAQYLDDPRTAVVAPRASGRRRRSSLLALGAVLALILPAIYVGSTAVTGLFVGTTPGSTPTGCAPNPGAPSGSPTSGYTEYTSSTTVSNRIFNASTDDDMINVTGGHVIFDHVTFRGTGTSDSGSSLEVSGSGSVEVRNSRFEGSPAEDYIQTKSADTSTLSLIECNVFVNVPGEDDVDMKSGGPVTVQNNTVQACASGGDTFIMQNSTSPIIIQNNTGVMSVFMTNGHHDGRVINNQVTACDSTLWVYDVSNILIQGNTVNTVKNGESGTSRSPSSIYYLDNGISSFQKNGGTCYATGNTGTTLSGCTNSAPSWYTG